MTQEELEAFLRQRGRADELFTLFDKLGFTRAFVLDSVLNDRHELTVTKTAIVWLGMPNKHDRKKTRQLLDALTDVGLLKPDEGGESWRSTVA